MAAMEKRRGVKAQRSSSRPADRGRPVPREATSPPACGKCGKPSALTQRTIRLEPEGEEPMEFENIDVHLCEPCGWVKPTSMTRMRLFQALGLHPENFLDRPVRVQMLMPTAPGKELTQEPETP